MEIFLTLICSKIGICVSKVTHCEVFYLTNLTDFLNSDLK